MSSPKTETLRSEWTNEMRQGQSWNMVSPQCVQSYLHGILLSFYWKEEHSGLWGRKVLSLENCFGRSSRGDTGEELSCSIFLISLNEWTKHFIAFPGDLWPLHMAEHESMIDHGWFHNLWQSGQGYTAHVTGHDRGCGCCHLAKRMVKNLEKGKWVTMHPKHSKR